jgi:hypothetical protein
MGLPEPFGMKRYVIALVVLIAGAIGLAVPLLTHGRSSKDTVPARNEQPCYFCARCRKEFTLTPEAYSRQAPDPETAARDRSAARRPHCPLCGARHSGWLMVTCPECGKPYLPIGAMPGDAATAGRTRDVCPHCKTDRGEWYRRHGGR